MKRWADNGAPVEKAAMLSDDDDEGWREGCDDCARRTAESPSDVSAWITPLAIIVFSCEFRIEPPNA